MEFTYSQYFKNDFVVPLLLYAFVLFCLVTNIVFLIKAQRRKAKTTEGDFLRFQPNLIAEFIFFAIVIALTVDFAFHFGRGVSLAWEKETDAVPTQGTVEEIEDMAYPGKYTLDGQVVWSKYLVIDGEKYYCMTGNCVQIGDSVEIEYLPKSKFILRIDKIDGEIGDLSNETTGLRVDLIVVFIVIFAICIAFLGLLFLSSALVRRKIGKRNFVGARKIALLYRKFLGGVKREKVSLLVALLYLSEGDRKEANEYFGQIKSPQLAAAKNYWRVIEAYLYDASEVDAKISVFELSDRATARGLPTYFDYRARLNLIGRYCETKDEAALSELEALVKDDDLLQTDLITKAIGKRI